MTEDQTTWKGHTFTLLVFTGIVVLCSIFFILGMLVGRAEGQKGASTGGLKGEAKPTPKEDKPDLTFYDSVKKDDPTALQRPPAPKVDADTEPAPVGSSAPSVPARVEPEKKANATQQREPVAEPAPVPAQTSPAPSSSINYQVGAVRKPADAQKLLDELKKKGFHAIIIAPPEGDPNPFYRVQVGPFTDVVAAVEAKKKLEAEKYQVYLKK